MVIVRTGRSSAPVFVPEGTRVRRPGWARARERGPFFHQKDREGLPSPALAAAGNDCEEQEQLRSIVLRSHGSKDGKESKAPRSPKRPPKRSAKVSTL
jgi:hypothetical protein